MSLKNVFRFRESTSTPESNAGSAAQNRAGMVAAPLFQSLPQDMQEQVFLNLHLWSYLEKLHFNGREIPEFVSRLNKSFKGNASNNLIYPVANKVFVHIYTAVGEARDVYAPIEPSSGAVTARLMEEVDQKLIDHVGELQSVVGEDQEKRIEVLTSILEKICDTSGNGKSRSGLKVTLDELAELQYLMIRDKEGMGAIQPLVSDPYIEDVSCSGVGAVFIEHKIFGGLTSEITFDNTEVLDQFVIKLSEKIGRPVTVRNPIVDSTLPDGSRINIVYGDDVSKRGSNFTIRKFQATPFSILDLVNSGTLSFEMASYLSLMLGAGMNTFVSGETASGKTTMLNAISTFIPPASKIVSIEDTPELQVPHPNWTREVVRNTVDGSSSVTMFDLLRAALRQRPNEISIGEIRGEEGAIAFQAMQTGHSSMATFHASSVERLIQRMTGHPINVPKTYIDNLNLVIIMSAVRLPDGSTGRRILSINEVIEYDTETDSFGFIEVFRWDSATDTFEYPGFMNTNLLEHVVAERRGMPPREHRQIYTILEERATILKNLAEQDITNFYELHNVITQANREGLFR